MMAIIIIVAVVFFLIVLLMQGKNRGQQDAHSSPVTGNSGIVKNALDQTHNLDQTRSSDQGIFLGVMLEDQNDHDPDRDWFRKGLEDEFPSNDNSSDPQGWTGSDQGNDTSSDNSSSDSGGWDSSDSSDGGSDSW